MQGDVQADLYCNNSLLYLYLNPLVELCSWLTCLLACCSKSILCLIWLKYYSRGKLGRRFPALNPSCCCCSVACHPNCVSTWLWCKFGEELFSASSSIKLPNCLAVVNRANWPSCDEELVCFFLAFFEDNSCLRSLVFCLTDADIKRSVSSSSRSFLSSESMWGAATFSSNRILFFRSPVNFIYLLIWSSVWFLFKASGQESKSCPWKSKTGVYFQI